MKRFSQRGMYNAVADVNIIPLMDLVFNLLIVFMLATPLLEQSINIKLPTAKSASDLNPKEFTTVSLDALGNVYLGKKKVSLTELENFLRAKIQTDPEHGVRIQSDKRVANGKFIELVDHLQLARVTKYSFATTPYP